MHGRTQESGTRSVLPCRRRQTPQCPPESLGLELVRHLPSNAGPSYAGISPMVASGATRLGRGAVGATRLRPEDLDRSSDQQGVAGAGTAGAARLRQAFLSADALAKPRERKGLNGEAVCEQPF
jgi:hypothetical protein